MKKLKKLKIRALFSYRRRLFNRGHVVDGRLRGTGGDRGHDCESMCVSGPVHGPQGVQQPVAVKPMRCRQYGVHNQWAVNSAVMGMASAVIVRYRQRFAGNA